MEIAFKDHLCNFFSHYRTRVSISGTSNRKTIIIKTELQTFIPCLDWLMSLLWNCWEGFFFLSKGLVFLLLGEHKNCDLLIYRTNFAPSQLGILVSMGAKELLWTSTPNQVCLIWPRPDQLQKSVKQSKQLATNPPFHPLNLHYETNHPESTLL